MLWVCENPECRTLYAVGLYGGCPHCGHPDFHEFGTKPEDEEHPMSPKIRRAGWASAEDASARAPEGGVLQVVEEPAVPAPNEEGASDAGTEATGEPAAAGEAAGAAGAAGAEPVGTEGEDSGRPAVGAAKGEHARYAAARYGHDEAWWDDEYTKRGLIDVLDRLDGGGAIVSPDGSIIDAEAPADPSADEASDGSGTVVSDVDDDSVVEELPEVEDRIDDAD